MRPQEIKLYLDEHHTAAEVNEQIREYLVRECEEYQAMPLAELGASLTSAANYGQRRALTSSEPLGIRPRAGDVCFIDYGRTYLKEAAYQHFGLVMSACCGKAFVVPMTSNPETYRQAYDALANPLGKRHLFALGWVPGLNKKSVLFLNDSKYLNTARIIDIKARIDPGSELFRAISGRLKECLRL